jgi:hypothetical protein
MYLMIMDKLFVFKTSKHFYTHVYVFDPDKVFSSNQTQDPFFRHLQNMKSLFETWKIEGLNDPDLAQIPRALPFDYTHSEEAWLQHQLHQLQEQVRKVDAKVFAGTF